jgi:hypothetical protein
MSLEFVGVAMILKIIIIVTNDSEIDDVSVRHTVQYYHCFITIYSLMTVRLMV